MEPAAILEALSKLAWPILAAIALWRILPAIRRVIESRAFTIKVGDFNVSVQEATERLSTDLEDVREKVSQLRAESAVSHLPSPDNKSVAATAAPKRPLRIPARPLARRVLWVDDKPEKKAFYISQIKSEGIDVIEARSTKESIDIVTSNPTHIGVIISNLGRWEGENFNHEAGIELIRALRQADANLPILMFTAKPKAARYSDPVIQAGADGITWSPVELFEMLHHFLPADSVNAP